MAQCDCPLYRCDCSLSARPSPRGVVQLFNAVQKHQKNVDEKVKEAGSSVRKQAKLISTVSKKDFISVLRGLDGSATEKGSAGRDARAAQVRLARDGDVRSRSEGSG